MASTHSSRQGQGRSSHRSTASSGLNALANTAAATSNTQPPAAARGRVSRSHSPVPAPLDSNGQQQQRITPQEGQVQQMEPTQQVAPAAAVARMPNVNREHQEPAADTQEGQPSAQESNHELPQPGSLPTDQQEQEQRESDPPTPLRNERRVFVFSSPYPPLQRGNFDPPLGALQFDLNSLNPSMSQPELASLYTEDFQRRDEALSLVIIDPVSLEPVRNPVSIFPSRLIDLDTASRLIHTATTQNRSVVRNPFDNSHRVNYVAAVENLSIRVDGTTQILAACQEYESRIRIREAFEAEQASRRQASNSNAAALRRRLDDHMAGVDIQQILRQQEEEELERKRECQAQFLWLQQLTFSLDDDDDSLPPPVLNAGRRARQAQAQVGAAAPPQNTGRRQAQAQVGAAAPPQNAHAQAHAQAQAQVGAAAPPQNAGPPLPRLPDFTDPSTDGPELLHSLLLEARGRDAQGNDHWDFSLGHGRRIAWFTEKTPSFFNQVDHGIFAAYQPISAQTLQTRFRAAEQYARQNFAPEGSHDAQGAGGEEEIPAYGLLFIDFWEWTRDNSNHGRSCQAREQNAESECQVIGRQPPLGPNHDPGGDMHFVRAEEADNEQEIQVPRQQGQEMQPQPQGRRGRGHGRSDSPSRRSVRCRTNTGFGGMNEAACLPRVDAQNGLYMVSRSIEILAAASVFQSRPYTAIQEDIRRTFELINQLEEDGADELRINSERRHLALLESERDEAASAQAHINRLFLLPNAAAAANDNENTG